MRGWRTDAAEGEGHGQGGRQGDGQPQLVHDPGEEGAEEGRVGVVDPVSQSHHSCHVCGPPNGVEGWCGFWFACGRSPTP